MRAIPPGAALAAAVLLLTPFAPALAQAPAAPAPPAMTDAARALLAAEDVRFQAELKHDAATLDRMTADDVVYSHATGQLDDKATVMRNFTRLPFTSITPTDRYARVIGDVGVVRGKVARQLPGRTLTDGYLAVYARQGGEWRLLEWVTVPMAAPPKP